MKQFYIDNDIDYDGNPLDRSLEFSKEDYYKSTEEDLKIFLESVQQFFDWKVSKDFILLYMDIYKDKYFR